MSRTFKDYIRIKSQQGIISNCKMQMYKNLYDNTYPGRRQTEELLEAAAQRKKTEPKKSVDFSTMKRATKVD